jgi:hypothetical protein
VEAQAQESAHMTALAQALGNEGGAHGYKLTLARTGIEPVVTHTKSGEGTAPNAGVNSVTARRDGKSISATQPRKDAALVWGRRLSNARRLSGPVVTRGVTSVTERRFDAEFRRRFRLALKSYPSGNVAQRLGVSKAIVKLWKAGTRDPSAPNLLALACMDKRIGALVSERIAHGMDPNDPRLHHEAQMMRMRAMDKGRD